MEFGVSLPVREMKEDLGALREFAQLADELGLTHLRVPDTLITPKGGYLHEPMLMLAWIAAQTQNIRLCPSILVLPVRQTVQVAKQIVQLDVLSEGRARIGVGIGASQPLYQALGQDFHTRGARCDEQLEVLGLLLSEESVDYRGRWHHIDNMGISPLPVQPKIPIWYGGASIPSDPVVRRIARFTDGWFVLCSPEDYAGVKSRIDEQAVVAGRAPSDIATEAGIAVVGPREAEWQQRITTWQQHGIDYICLRTLGGELTPAQHIEKLAEVVPQARALVA